LAPFLHAIPGRARKQVPQSGHPHTHTPLINTSGLKVYLYKNAPKYRILVGGNVARVTPLSAGNFEHRVTPAIFGIMNDHYHKRFRQNRSPAAVQHSKTVYLSPHTLSAPLASMPSEHAERAHSARSARATRDAKLRTLPAPAGSNLAHGGGSRRAGHARPSRRDASLTARGPSARSGAPCAATSATAASKRHQPRF
jgi:hypothetical protein